VSTFLNDLGRSCSKITLFMRSRASRVGMDHHVLIDGTLNVNFLRFSHSNIIESRFSRS
jgi:hypothetical protein